MLLLLLLLLLPSSLIVVVAVAVTVPSTVSVPEFLSFVLLLLLGTVVDVKNKRDAPLD